MAKTKHAAPKFARASANEMKMNYRDLKFLLVEKDRGVYGAGRAVQLYRLDGLDKVHIKEIGWTKSDNNMGCERSDAFLNGIVTFDQCVKAASNYIDVLLD